MSRESFVTCTCDRCGATATIQQGHLMPEKWGEIFAQQSVDRGDHIRGISGRMLGQKTKGICEDLCELCCVDLWAWFDAPRQTPEEKPR